MKNMAGRTVVVKGQVGVIRKFKYNKTVPAFAGTHYFQFALFDYALWRLMASVISSNDALHGNIGSKYMFAVPAVILPCFGQ